MTDHSTDADLRNLILDLNQELLRSIVESDYPTYDSLVADDISCIEPEANQHVVLGKKFHKYYFDIYGKNRGDSSTTTTTGTNVNVTMSQPHVQIVGGGTVAIVSYIKLTQKGTETIQQSETRVWEKLGKYNDQWKNIHFHKSPIIK
jgi:hypothetical protein